MQETKRSRIYSKKKNAGERTMTGLYIISGAQIGSLMAQSDGKLTDELKYIINNQYLYDSKNIIKEDIKTIKRIMKK